MTSRSEATGIDVDAFDDGGFGSVGGGKDEVGNVLLARQDGDGQHAGDGAHAAVESQFADEKESIDVVDTQRTVGAEDSDGDGKVETGAFFLQVGGSEIDGDEGGRNGVAGVLDGGAHTIATLTYRRIGQAYGVKDILLSDNAAVINFYVDQVSVDSIYSCTKGFK